ncbi:hypothetical protein [Amycolatopsis sp. NPDC004378]
MITAWDFGCGRLSKRWTFDSSSASAGARQPRTDRRRHRRPRPDHLRRGAGHENHRRPVSGGWGDPEYVRCFLEQEVISVK